MENWGLVTFGGDALLIDPDNTDPDAHWHVLEVVSHELAHQWTGNLVTMKWWDQTWLNEAFATFLSFLTAENLEPETDPWARFLVHLTQSVMLDDAGETSWAMSDPVKSRSDIGRKFGHITYFKGASVLRMFESVLGRSTFIKGLSSYLDQFQFSNTVEEQLFAHFQAAADEDETFEGDLDKTMKTWTNQAGVPLVEVTRGDLGHLILTQSRYGAGEDQLWDIPINWIDVKGPSPDWSDTSPMAWLTEKELVVEFVASPDLVLINKQATGYYRVNYDEDTWQDIGTQLLEDHIRIHPLTRASLICDVVSLNQSGHVNQLTMELVLSYREAETDFAPLLAFKQCVDSDFSGSNLEKSIFENDL